MKDLQFSELTAADSHAMLRLTQYLNPDLSSELLIQRHEAMFTYDNYRCWGLFKKEELIGVCGGWITTRLYSGKQLEIDHFIINPAIQSNGYGQLFIEYLEKWCLDNAFENLELNTYITNTRSHEFYERLGYQKKGFHFLKELK